MFCIGLSCETCGALPMLDDESRDQDQQVGHDFCGIRTELTKGNHCLAAELTLRPLWCWELWFWERPLCGRFGFRGGRFGFGSRPAASSALSSGIGCANFGTAAKKSLHLFEPQNKPSLRNLQPRYLACSSPSAYRERRAELHSLAQTYDR